jgi:hypothetical protein
VTAVERVAGLLRWLGQLHEHPAAIAGWQAWTRPVLAWLTPGRRRALLAVAALEMVVNRPLREMAPAVRLSMAGGLAAATIVIVACFAFVCAAYAVARRFPSLPAVVRARPQLWLHGLFWSLVTLRWLLPEHPGVGALALSGLVLTLPFLLWRVGYLLVSAQRGRMEGTRFRDHLLYLYPFYGGSNAPYGKGIDYLARHEARTEEALARSQLAGIKLLVLFWIYHQAQGLMAGLVYAEPRGVLSAYGLGVPRVEQLLPMGAAAPWAAAWASLFAAFFWDVLKLTVRGHRVIGIVRLFGFHVFRNTYKPLLAPSIVEFWNRYYYYFKEMLVDFFFFPTYLRYFRRHPRLRMLAAVLAAAGLGNLYYHLLQKDPFLLHHDVTEFWPWLGSRAFYCLLLSLGIYVSMRGEQQRRGSPATPGATGIVWVGRVLGVWTFYAVLSIWADPSSASFAQRVEFFLALFGLR